MQVLRVAIQAAKAGTLRSAQSLPRTAAEGVVVALVLLLPALAVLVVASGQRVFLPVLRERTARAAVVVVPHQQA